MCGDKPYASWEADTGLIWCDLSTIISSSLQTGGEYVALVVCQTVLLNHCNMISSQIQIVTPS